MKYKGGIVIGGLIFESKKLINRNKAEIYENDENIKDLMMFKKSKFNGNESIVINENGIIVNESLTISENDKQFKLLMNIYENASNKVLETINGIEKEYNNMFNKSIINHTTSRIKAPKSIVNKMKKKNLEVNYRSLVNNIHDIAGVRVICPLKDDVYTIVKIVEKIPNWNLICEKDYIKNPKKSGYSGYHIIVEVPVKYSDDGFLGNQIFVKVEIQIRTMAMDFWATNEHKMKYKSKGKLSFWNSKRLIMYAKIINLVDDRFNRIGCCSYNDKMKW